MTTEESKESKQIKELYEQARSLAGTGTDEKGDEYTTEEQKKIVYRWLSNHARSGKYELITKFLNTEHEETREKILALKDFYCQDAQRNVRRDNFENNGLTLLHVAVLFENIKVVELLLPEYNDKFKLLMERSNPEGWLALHLCTTHVEEEGIKVVTHLLKAYEKEYNRVYEMESTLLVRFRAAFHDARAMTPLHYATWASNHEVVKQMLSKESVGDQCRPLGTIMYVHSVDLFLLTPLHISALVLTPLKDGPVNTGRPRKVKDTIQTAKLLIRAAKESSMAHDSHADADEESMLDVCINAVDCCSYTPLHWAAYSDASEIMKLLLQEDGKIKTLEKDRDKKTPLHVAMESSARSVKESLTDVGKRGSTSSKKLLISNKVVKEDVDRRLKERQIIVDSSNATLVGASLVASVTFAAILHPPLGWVKYFKSTYRDTPPGPDAFREYAAVDKDVGVLVFWIFNCLSFLFATSTVISSSVAVRPKSGVHIRDMVVSTKTWLLFTSYLFITSIIFVLGAFVAAGITALPPITWMKVKIFIAPGSFPLLVSLVLCILFLSNFRDETWRAMKTFWKSVRATED
ncbi:hypothetical protein Mapa_013816 [Marchantia paleacea]|nr:hypothetical protein Mapa_013816 [Marchantia paleacea]